MVVKRELCFICAFDAEDFDSCFIGVSLTSPCFLDDFHFLDGLSLIFKNMIFVKQGNIVQNMTLILELRSL